MITREQLKEAVHAKGVSRKDQVLLCLLADSLEPKSISSIREIAVSVGLPKSATWNISAMLSSLPGKAIRTPKGWEIGPGAKASLDTLLKLKRPGTSGTLSSLRAHLLKLKPDARAFVEEALGCAESGFHRAAVVLSWVGALSVLYDYVLRTNVSAFNSEARRRDAKWKDAKTPEDIARMKEYEFLQVLEATSTIGKSVKTELEGCLKLRNGCGHPNRLKIADLKVSAHIETLILNVFAVYT